MKISKRIQALVGLLILVLQVLISPMVALAATTPSGSKSFAPVGAKYGNINRCLCNSAL